MARYRVIRTIPAMYFESYDVDAFDEGEAIRSLEGGRCSCSRRWFSTSSGVASISTKAVELANSATENQDYHTPEPDGGEIKRLTNAVFLTSPGSNDQTVVQEDF